MMYGEVNEIAVGLKEHTLVNASKGHRPNLKFDVV